MSNGDYGDRDRRVAWPPSDSPTLASILSDEGFDTRLITSNGYFSSTNSSGYGFGVELLRSGQSADVLANAVIRESRTLGADGERWYLHVHFYDPHHNYTAPRAYWTDPRLDCPWDVANVFVQYRLEGDAMWRRLDREGRALARQCLMNIYEGEYRYWDEHFGEMWAELEDSGLLEDTLVAFWTDHGESFGEHDNAFIHGVTLYDTENRSTAAFWARDIEPLRWTGPTTHQDIAPTILQALDVPLGDHTGRVLGRARPDRVRVAFDYTNHSDPYISAIRNDKKLMYWWDGTKRFFDISVDPEERDDLYDASDPDVQALWEELQPLVEHKEDVWGLTASDVGP
jgi:arylsulfatase A-like enzyme